MTATPTPRRTQARKRLRVEQSSKRVRAYPTYLPCRRRPRQACDAGRRRCGGFAGPQTTHGSTAAARARKYGWAPRCGTSGHRSTTCGANTSSQPHDGQGTQTPGRNAMNHPPIRQLGFDSRPDEARWSRADHGARRIARGAPTRRTRAAAASGRGPKRPVREGRSAWGRCVPRCGPRGRDRARNRPRLPDCRRDRRCVLSSIDGKLVE